MLVAFQLTTISIVTLHAKFVRMLTSENSVLSAQKSI